MPRLRISPKWTITVVAAVAVVAAVVIPLSLPDREPATVLGLKPGQPISPTALSEVVLTSWKGTDGLTATLDGEELRLRPAEHGLVPDVGDLKEGKHTLVVFPPPDTWGRDDPLTIPFVVDNTPPELSVEPPEPVKQGAAGEIRGTARGAVLVSAGDQRVKPAKDGSFVLPVRGGAGTITVTAHDAAGNEVTEQVPVALRHPGMRAVHMTASAWASDELRAPVMELVREGRIDSIQLDIKDESGQIGYASQVPLAQQIGANTGIYDARAALDLLHSEGVHVVGRLVAFRDPVLGRTAWESGDTDWLVQTSGGSAWSGGYGDYSFTNFAHPEVRAYNLALAEEAAELGFDDILYDYIRRPDGNLDDMVFPDLTTTPEQSIADFLAESRVAVHRHGAFQGASVFGIAASRPEQIAQDIPAMSEHVDYVAPMVYPSHWGPGEYGVADPENQPYDITRRSLADFQDLAGENGHGKVIPWLQSFSLGVTYGPDEIRAQIEAAEDIGIDSFLLWNAACRYDGSALPPM